MKQHVKQLKDLHQFDIVLKGDIKSIIENPREWAEKIAEDKIMEEMPRYLKARTLGENFAREINSNS